MKVIHVLTTPESLCFLKRQAAFIQSHGVEIHAVSSPGCELEFFGESEQVTTHAVRMTRTVSPLRDAIAVTQLFRIFRRERPNIVHTHTPKANLVATIAAWLAGVPCRIVHLHGLPHSTAMGFVRTILRWSTRVPSMLATDLFAVSQSVADMAVKDGLCSAGRIKVLGNGSSNGVDVNQFFPAADENVRRRRSLGLSESDLVIGFAGRLVRDKGVMDLYRSWEQLRDEFPNGYLVIAGQPELRDAVPTRILRCLERDPRVRMLGHCKDMPEFYACLDVFVLPSYREGLPKVILESAAMAVPTVAFRSVGCVDAIVDGVTGTLVAAGDCIALTDALRIYLNRPDLRRRHGISARERVLRDFRPEDVWQATLNQYRIATSLGRSTARATISARR